jgi:hypothetical protein
VPATCLFRHGFVHVHLIPLFPWFNPEQLNNKVLY